MRGRTQSPPGARVGAGGLQGRTHHWQLDISPGWFAGGQRRASRERGLAKKIRGKTNKLSAGVSRCLTSLNRSSAFLWKAQR
eukprot:scaffold89952_cov30-Phaeocystis_antarctica.AAC.1